jgi:hypothetical protein
MNKAFQTHLNALCKSLKCPSVLENADDTMVKDYASRWNAFAQAETNGDKNSMLCNQKNIKVIPELKKAFPDIRNACSETCSVITDWRATVVDAGSMRGLRGLSPPPYVRSGRQLPPAIRILFAQ